MMLLLAADVFVLGVAMLAGAQSGPFPGRYTLLKASTAIIAVALIVAIVRGH